VRVTRQTVVEARDDAPAMHIRRLVENVDARAIRRRRFRIVIDCCNGAGIAVLPALLDKLGCRTTVLFGDPARAFERPAEPLPENLTALRRRVKREKADLGFAVDPDADRLAIVDECGRPLGEERTLTLAAYRVLQKRRSAIAANLSTTRALDDLAETHGVRVHRTPVGEAHVVDAIRRRRLLIGGEGNGGVIWPQVTSGRDSVAAIGLILDALAATHNPISELNRLVPDYVMLKKKVPLAPGKLKRSYARLERRFGKQGTISRTDGLRVDLPRGWFHLRPSGTEPIVRLYVEAPTRKEAEALAADVEELL
jgi:phosphomannomutase